MKKWKIMLPSLMSTTAIPLVSLAGCGQDPIVDTTPLHFIDVADDGNLSQISYTIDGRDLDIHIQYKLDDGDDIDDEQWCDWAKGQTITLENGQKLYVRNTKSTLSSLDSHFKFITSAGGVITSGNVNSMINFKKLTEACFFSLFSGCKTLKSAPNLPARTLAKNCYQNMFSECSGLDAAPESPAEYLTDYCYAGMFNGCSNIKVAPELKSTHLAPHCYEQMFEMCGFTVAPVLPASKLVEVCYAFMFCHCPITKTPELPTTNLAADCYRYMFSNCRQLVQTMDSLPATNLKARCYDHMFSYCYELKTAPEIKAQVESHVEQMHCYEKMFADCKKLKVREEEKQNNYMNERLICSFPLNIGIDYFADEMFRGCILQPETFTPDPKPGYAYYLVS